MVDFMGFVPSDRGGFFFFLRWWWWVSCGKGGGDGFFRGGWCWLSCGRGGGGKWLKERDNEEKINRVMGEK